jgi:hypothetical protein
MAIPTPADLSTLLGQLLGRDVVATKPAKPIEQFDTAAVAVYQGSGGGVAGWWALELSPAAGAAAALSMVSPGVVADALKAKALNELLLENLREVLNVGARLFGATGLKISLREVLTGPKAKEAMQNLQFIAERVDMDVKIGGYAGGRMRLGVVER